MQYFDVEIISKERLFAIVHTTKKNNIQRIELLVSESELGDTDSDVKAKLKPFGEKFTLSVELGRLKPEWSVQLSIVVIAPQKNQGFNFSIQGAQGWLSTYTIERISDIIKNAFEQKMIGSKNIVIFPELASFLVKFTHLKSGRVRRFEMIETYTDYATLLDRLLAAVYDKILVSYKIQNKIELYHAWSISTWAMPLLAQKRNEGHTSFCIMVDPPALKRSVSRTVVGFIKSGIGNIAKSDAKELSILARQKVRSRHEHIDEDDLGTYQTPALKQPELLHTSWLERFAYKIGFNDFFIAIFRDGIIQKFVRLLTSHYNPSYKSIMTGTRCIIEFAADSSLTEFFISSRAHHRFWKKMFADKNTPVEKSIIADFTQAIMRGVQKMDTNVRLWILINPSDHRASLISSDKTRLEYRKLFKKIGAGNLTEAASSD